MKIEKSEIQKILYANANMKIDRDSYEHKLLYELIKNHPKAEEKIGCGIDYFFVQQSKWK